MKKNILYTCILSFLCTIHVAAQGSLKGRVKDAMSGEPLVGATVYFPDLKSGSVTDINGFYQILKLPLTKLMVQVKYIGYSTILQSVDLAKTSETDFVLKPTVIESQEVEVTGSAFTTDGRKNSMAVVPVDRAQLLSVSSGNLVQSLAQIPGVSQVSTGYAISKPVIRGLGFNRIVTINEGIRQEGQQWGDEHGLEIDPFAPDRIEILKGPGSLLYGSDALGGVINILEPLPPPAGVIRGEMVGGYAQNNSMASGSFLAEGNHDGWIWRSRASYKNAASYQTPTERVYNSAFNEWSSGLMTGLNKSWGYSHLHASHWESNIGLTEGDRDSVTGLFVNNEGVIVNNADLNSRNIFLPKQNIVHSKITSVNNLILGNSQLRLNLGWQENARKEFEESAANPGLFFELNTETADVRYYFPEINQLEMVAGFSLMNQKNKNRGSEFLVPDYSLFSFGFFTSAKKTIGKSTLNGGIRFDRHQTDGNEMRDDGTIRFEKFISSFEAVSASAGLTHSLSKLLNLKLNAGRGFRAPNISELAANGIHEGTFRYEIGNAALRPETTLQFDAALQADAKKWNLEFNLFFNRINNFIYYRNINKEVIDQDGKLYPVYRYVQGNSSLYGFEFSSDIHLLEHLHFGNNASWVRGTNTETGNPLPFIPALKTSHDLNFEFHFKKETKVKEVELRAGMDHYLKQNRVDEFETETPGYVILNFSASAQVKTGKQQATLQVSVNNATNRKYYDHLSRLKTAGIYNMGRNISILLRLPFGIR